MPKSQGLSSYVLIQYDFTLYENIGEDMIFMPPLLIMSYEVTPYEIIMKSMR